MAAKEMQYNNGKDPSKGTTGWYQQVKARAVRLVARMNKLGDEMLCTTNKDTAYEKIS